MQVHRFSIQRPKILSEYVCMLIMVPPYTPGRLKVFDFLLIPLKWWKR
uniref:Uncharacterized protein n=1 Tax=Arundo donax TaxID=35708 RepID=A0A0A8ZET6_ARUDO